MNKLDVEFLILEGAALKCEISRKIERLRQINLMLAESARFENGRKTARLAGGGYKVEVRLLENIAWDQKKLVKLRGYLPEDRFRQIFNMIYEPTSRRAIDGFITYAEADFSNALRGCMSVKPGAPQVTYEKLL